MQARDLLTVQSQGTSHMPFSLENGSNTVSLDESYRALLRVKVKQMKKPVTTKVVRVCMDKNLALSNKEIVILLRGAVLTAHTYASNALCFSYSALSLELGTCQALYWGIFLRI